MADPDSTVETTVQTVSTVMETIQTKVAEHGMNVLIALIIFIIGRIIARMLANALGKTMKKTKAEATLVTFTENFSYSAIMVFVIIAALARAGVPVTSFAAVVAAAGLAIGLALQGSLSNFASGFLMMIFRPIRVGDYVEVGGAAGVVQEIQIFNTILNSPDNIRIVVPNSSVTGSNIKNYSINGTRRVDLVIGVSYGDDLKKARQVIEEVLTTDERILKDPAPQVAVAELGDSSVNFVVRPWVKGADYWNVRFDVTEKVKVALEANGCSIPFPQRDVHLYQEKA